MTGERTVLTPSQVGGYLKNLMDRDRLLSSLLVRGELSNYKMYPSGHHYFTLKDSEGALRCVMFRGDASLFASGRRTGCRWLPLAVSPYSLGTASTRCIVSA